MNEMKRISPFYAFAGFEILRYFTLAWILELMLASTSPQILRFLAAPNLMFGAAFFFLALDSARYGVYRPLILVGKAAAIFAALVAAPGLLVMAGQSRQAGLSILVGLAFVVIWDIVATLVLLFHTLPVARMDTSPMKPTEPEVVEVD